MESESLFGANLCICMPRTLYFDLTVPTFLFVSFKRGGGIKGTLWRGKDFLTVAKAVPEHFTATSCFVLGNGMLL